MGKFFKIMPFITSRNARDVIKKMFTYEKTNSKLGVLAHNVSFSTCINVGKILYKLFFCHFALLPCSQLTKLLCRPVHPVTS